METFSEEVKPIGLETNELKNRQKKKTNWSFSHLHPRNIPSEKRKLKTVLSEKKQIKLYPCHFIP